MTCLIDNGRLHPEALCRGFPLLQALFHTCQCETRSHVCAFLAETLLMSRDAHAILLCAIRAKGTRTEIIQPSRPVCTAGAVREGQPRESWRERSAWTDVW